MKAPNTRCKFLALLMGALGLATVSGCTNEPDTPPEGAGDRTYLTLSVQPAELRQGNTANVTAHLESAASGLRSPQSGTRVFFTLPAGGGALSSAEASTNDEGDAIVTFTAGGADGAFTIQAALFQEGSSEEARAGENIALTTVVIDSNITAGPPAFIEGGVVTPSAISTNAQASVSVTVLDADRNPAPNVIVNFEMVSGSLADATLSPSDATDSAGVASAIFKAGTSVGSATIRAFVPGTDPVLEVANLTITVKPPRAGSIRCGRVSPQLIGVKGSGFGEVSDVDFDILYVDGRPADGIEVEFTLIGPGGGEFLDPLRTKSIGGTATTQVHSGTTSGPVAVRARITSETVDDVVLETTCSGVAISGGVPDAHHFTIAFSETIIEGLICVTPPSSDDGTSDVTAAYSDVFGHRLPLYDGQGRLVSFFSEAGGIGRLVEGNDEGFASTRISTQRPGPIDTDPVRTTIPELFLDVNNNGQYDFGEPFDDKDLSGTRDLQPCDDFCEEVPANPRPAGTPTNYAFPSYYFNPGDGLVNVVGVTEGQEGFYDVNNNGLYDSGEKWDDLGEPWVDANGDGIYNGVRHDPDPASPNAGTCKDETDKDYPSCNPSDYDEPYFDANFNGHYEVGIDPYEDRNGNGIRDVAESFVDNKNLAGNRDNVYDLKNGRWDANTLIYAYGPNLVPGSNRSHLGPGGSLIFNGGPYRNDMQVFTTLCVIDGAVMEDGVDEDCSGFPSLTTWFPAYNFRIPAGQFRQFRAFIMDRFFNPMLLDATYGASLDGGGELLGGDNVELGGSRMIGFGISAEGIGADDDPCEAASEGALVETEGSTNIVCVGEVLYGAAAFGEVGGLPQYIRDEICTGAPPVEDPPVEP